MILPTWQLPTAIPAIIFDCDGTLSNIEGINELARYNGVGLVVEALTAEAMGKTGLSSTLYQRRLELVHPTEEQVLSLGRQYFAHQAPDTDLVIQALQRLNKSIYIVSAGLLPAITIFADLLQVPKDHVFAVDIQFDRNGRFQSYDETSPLVTVDGKRTIVSALQKEYGELIYIGDGLNDLAVKDLVTRFIGYGGAYYRENIAKLCDFYIHTHSLASVLPLCLTQSESESLLPDEQALYNRGLAAIHSREIKT